MTLKSIEKLRKCLTFKHEYASTSEALRREYDETTVYYALEAACDAIESEVAERFMELPVDADGEVIRLGDTLLKSTGAPMASYGEVVAVSDDSVWFDRENGGYEANWAKLTRHRRKPTVEDVMHDYALAFMDCDGQDTGELDAEYVGKLREAVRAE